MKLGDQEHVRCDRCGGHFRESEAFLDVDTGDGDFCADCWELECEDEEREGELRREMERRLWSAQMRELLVLGIERGWSLTSDDLESMRALFQEGKS